jgi:tetratricopeptide (TPR) repeat protein
MKRMVKLWISIFLLSLAAPAPLLGSRPIDYTMVGGVIDGLMFCLEKGVFIEGSPPELRAEYIRLSPPSVNLAPYEGKKIRLQGRLYPAHVFKPDLEKGIEVLGACDEEDRVAIRKELPWAYHDKAKQLSQNDWNNAWNFLNKAIEIDNSNCSLYATKADFYQKQGKFEEAVKEAQRAVDYGCNRYPDWVFLAELLEKVGKNSAAIDAYTKAVGVCGYKPDRDKFLQKIEQLGGSIDNIPMGEDGGKEF